MLVVTAVLVLIGVGFTWVTAWQVRDDLRRWHARPDFTLRAALRRHCLGFLTAAIVYVLAAVSMIEWWLTYERCF